MFTYLLSLTSFCQKANYFPNDQHQNMEVAPFVTMDTSTNSFLTEGSQLVYLQFELDKNCSLKNVWPAKSHWYFIYYNIKVNLG